MKKFLILQLRPEDEAADQEFAAFLQFGNLTSDDVERIRLEQAGLPPIDLANYSGVIIGGGPSNVSDPQAKKSEAQLRFEKDLQPLFSQIIDQDFPYFGNCYGLGYLIHHLKGSLSHQYREDAGAVTVFLTTEGKNDPLFQNLPHSFDVFLGHKEAVDLLPPGVILLAGSSTCPVEAVRYKKNIYAFQFHPELTAEGLITRINIYKNAGYFKPEEMQALIEKVTKASVTQPMTLLQNFVQRYKRD